MDVLVSILTWIAKNIVDQPALLLGIIAFVGLVAQKKSFSDTVTGTLKTSVGFLILTQGANIVVGAIIALTPILEGAFGFKAAALGGSTLTTFTATYGGYASLIMTFAFLINVFIARVTPLKFVYLTGHLMWWMSLVILATMVEITAKAPGWAYVLVGSVILGIYFTVQPAYIQPLIRKITGHNELAYGHTSSSAVWVSGKLGKYVGKPEDSSETFKLPNWMTFFRDVTAGTAVIISLLLIVAALIAGPTKAADPSGNLNYLVYAFMQGLTFSVGITVLLVGVRMLIAEIVPAFRGIALKIVPDAKPALDCPIVFDFAPTAVILGFLSATVVFFILMMVLGLTHLAVIVPPFIMLFFPGGAAGVFGNSTGGTKGAILGGAICGLMLAVGQAVVTPMLGHTAPELAQLADPDWYIIFLIFRPLLVPVMALFGG